MTGLTPSRADFEMETGGRKLHAVLGHIVPLLEQLRLTHDQIVYYDPRKTAVQFHVLDGIRGQALIELIRELSSKDGQLGAPKSISYSADRVLEGLVFGPSASDLYEQASGASTLHIIDSLQELEMGYGNLWLLCFDILVGVMFMRFRDDNDYASVAGYPVSFLSYCSHAEGFLLMTRNPSDSRKRFSLRFESFSARLLQRVRRIASDACKGRVGSRPVGWIEFFEGLQLKVKQAIKMEGLMFVRADGYLGATTDLRESKFHQIIEASPQFQHFMEQDCDFIAGRFVTGFLYLTLHRLGLPLVERYFLCYAISRCVESIYDISAEAALANFMKRSCPNAGR